MHRLFTFPAWKARLSADLEGLAGIFVGFDAAGDADAVGVGAIELSVGKVCVSLELSADCADEHGGYRGTSLLGTR